MASIRPAEGAGRAVAWLALAAALAGAALVAPFDHDETQYYAAARLSAGGLWPYRDFPLMQTPLFAWTMAGLAQVAGQQLLVAGRVAQALLAIATLAVLWRTARRLGGAGWVAVGVACTSWPFLFAATVFRNDMLAVLMEAGAIAALLPGSRGSVERGLAPGSGAGLGPGSWSGPGVRALVVNGLLICLAASTKVTFGVLGLAPLAWIATLPLSSRRRLILAGALAVGAMLGLVPALVGVLAAPERFVWQVVTFNAGMPRWWLAQMGEAGRMTLAGRAGDGLGVLLLGPMLPVIALAAWRGTMRQRELRRGRRVTLAGDRAAVLRGADRQCDRRRTLLVLFAAAALVAAMVPAPVHRQYFAVLVPPLALLAAFDLPSLATRARRRWALAIAAFACAGLGAAIVRVAGAGPGRSVLAHQATAHRIGAAMDAAGVTGPIATLAADVAVASGHLLDPAFAAGPFAWRWAEPGRTAEIAAKGAVTAAGLDAHFAACPPGAIVTGYEPALERPLRAWAVAHGWRPRQVADGVAIWMP